jgi:hypothetical protein
MEAYDSVNPAPSKIDPQENPQSYSRFVTEVEHPKASRHILGLVGGNEVSLTKTNWADIESDLKGITRPNSDSTERHHLPSASPIIERSNPKQTIRLDTNMQHLKPVQFFAYPSVIGPEPLVKETCGQPHKY